MNAIEPEKRYLAYPFLGKPFPFLPVFAPFTFTEVCGILVT
jgi:hypothetical protein